MLQNNKRISIKEESFGVLSGIEIFISNKWYNKHGIYRQKLFYLILKYVIVHSFFLRKLQFIHTWSIARAIRFFSIAADLSNIMAKYWRFKGTVKPVWI